MLLTVSHWALTLGSPNATLAGGSTTVNSNDSAPAIALKKPLFPAKFVFVKQKCPKVIPKCPKLIQKCPSFFGHSVSHPFVFIDIVASLAKFFLFPALQASNFARRSPSLLHSRQPHFELTHYFSLKSSDKRYNLYCFQQRRRTHPTLLFLALCFHRNRRIYQT